MVFSAARSDPPDGSVIAMAATISPVQNLGSQRCFCSSVHRSTRYGATQSTWMPTQEEYAKASLDSSSASTSENRGSPVLEPPYSSGTFRPEQALLAELQPDLATELVVGDVLLLVRPQMPVDEGPAGHAEGLVILGEDRPLHCWLSLSELPVSNFIATPAR